MMSDWQSRPQEKQDLTANIIADFLIQSAIDNDIIVNDGQNGYRSPLILPENGGFIDATPIRKFFSFLLDFIICVGEYRNGKPTRKEPKNYTSACKDHSPNKLEGLSSVLSSASKTKPVQDGDEN